VLANAVEWRGRARRAFVALALTLFSGAATAAYAGFALETAWTSYAHCNPPPAGFTCTSTAFWNLPPGWFLLACLAGIVVGLLTAIVGWELHRRAFGLTRGSYAILALSLAGLVAYGGLGVGAAAGVAGALLFSSLRTRRTGAPEAWSGVLPVGVPPVKTPVRPISEKPAVAEWDGVSMPAVSSAATPSSGGGLPSADRLAAALARTRVSGSSGRPAAARPPAIVLLPPPPTISSARTAPPPSPPPPFHSEASPVAAPMAEATASRRPAPPISPTPSSTRTSEARAPTLGSHPLAAPAHEPVVRAAAPPPLPSRSPPPVPAPSGGRAPAPARLKPVPEAPSSSAPAPALPPRVHLEGGETRTGVRPTTGRNRAWTCPKCRLMNAPWSDHCTKCRTPGPTA
jgi:hypothetical protein